ncbi:MAG: RDD family protein [Elusimicrobiota bacterium]
MDKPTDLNAPREITSDMQVGGDIVPARILARFAAIVIDGILVGLVSIGVGMAVGVADRWLSIGLFLVYETLMVGSGGQTLGKKLLKVKVILADGQPIAYGRSFVRAIGSRVSQAVLFLGCAIAIFTKDKRALHDYIAGTRVIEAN